MSNDHYYDQNYVDLHASAELKSAITQHKKQLRLIYLDYGFI